MEFDDRLTQATAQIRPQDVLYLQPERILKELPATSRLGRNLNALLKISRVVHSISDLDQLQEQILELIFEVVPAERGAILLDGKGNEKFSSLFAYPGRSGAEPVRVSRTITTPGDGPGSSDPGSGRAGQRRLERSRKPGEFQGALVAVRAPDGVSESDRLHLPGHHQSGHPL